MNKLDVIDYFNGRINAADAIGITPQAISLWEDVVPPRSEERVRKAMALEKQRRIDENDPDGTIKYPKGRRPKRRRIRVREIK